MPPAPLLAVRSEAATAPSTIWIVYAPNMAPGLATFLAADLAFDLVPDLAPDPLPDLVQDVTPDFVPVRANSVRDVVPA